MKIFFLFAFFLVQSVISQNIDDLGIRVHGQGRQYVFTNKEAGTYHGEVNRQNSGGWQGWYINAEKILHDYSVAVHGSTLDRTGATSTVFPHQIVRTYANGIKETVTLLDSVDVVLIEINSPAARISLFPVESFDMDSTVSSMLQLWKNNRTSSDLTPAYIGVANGVRDTVSVFAIAAGENISQIHRTLFSAIKNSDEYKNHRKQRMQSILDRSFTRFNDDRLTKALGWAKIQIDALIMNQATGGKRTKGIFAGLPWFNNYWGRDSFIALPGATYVTGNFSDAREVLLSYADFQEKDTVSVNFGRIPNLATPQSVIYNTADGTPWFVRSMFEYTKYSGDTSLLRELYPVLVRSIEGTIKHHTDSSGFLTHGDAETWMDAVGPNGPWSPRGNRANDIQALWYEQLMIGIHCAELFHDKDHSSAWKDRTKKIEKNFAVHFVDTTKLLVHDHLNQNGLPSKEFRPNQLFTLDMPMQENVRRNIVRSVLKRLVYEHGTATLAHDDSNFYPYHEHPPYYVKDAAYHNGTVWTWLNGPLIRAAVRYDLQETVFPVTENSVHQILERGCVGALSELLDAYPKKGIAARAEKNNKKKNPGKSVSGVVLRSADSVYAEPKLSGTYSQAWSLSEFVRSVYQDYIGIIVDLPARTISINPKLPLKITSLEAVQQVGKGSVRFSYSIIGDSVTVTLAPKNLDARFTVNYSYVYPNGDAVITPVDLVHHSPLTIVHTKTTLTVFHEKEIVLQERESQAVFSKNYSAKKYFTGVMPAQPDFSRKYRVLQGPSHHLLTHQQVRARPVAAKSLFSVTDPSGDDNGASSTFVYPSSTHFQKGILDITGARFSYDKKNLYCTLIFANLYDPGWHPEYGFQLTLTAIAINTGKPGQREIGLNSHFLLDESRSFDKMIVIGGGIRIVDAKNAVICEYLPRSEDVTDPIGNVKEKKIEFALPLEYLGIPNTKWKVTILTGGQDDHGGAGIGEFRSVNTEAGEWQGGGKKNSKDPNMYDILTIN